MKQLRPSELPFYATEMSWAKRQVKINLLLEKFGIQDYQWNSVLGVPELQFGTDVEIVEGQKQYVKVILKVPVFIEKHKSWDADSRKTKTVESPNLAQTGAILYNTLRGQLTAISGGVVRFEEIFLSDLAVSTPTGQKRFADWLRDKNLLGGKGLVALPEIMTE